MVHKRIIHGVPCTKPLSKSTPALRLPPPFGGSSVHSWHQLCSITQTSDHRTKFLCFILRISKFLWTKRTLFCSNKLLSLKRWEEGSDHCFSDCREFSARLEAITRNWMEIHTKKKNSLHMDQAKRKITVPSCHHLDKLSLHFREFLTEDKEGTNFMSLAIQHC